MNVHVIVPALIARDPDLATLLRQRHDELAARFRSALPPGWAWTQPRRGSGGLVFSVAQFAEASLRESVLATGRRGDGANAVSCRLDMMGVAVFRRTVEWDAAPDYAALGALGDDIARELSVEIGTVCTKVAAALGTTRPADDSNGLSPGVALWSHRIAEASGRVAEPVGGAPAEVLPGLWIADGQTTVNTDLVDVEQVLIALELATVHWLTIDSLNRTLFSRLTKLYDDKGSAAGSLEAAYLEAVEAAGTVTAVEMLLEDQRQCLPTTARVIYSAYARQWELAELRAALARRAGDIVDYDARRVDYLHAKQAQRTSDLVLLLTLATLVPAVLAVADFVTGKETLGIHNTGRVLVLVAAGAVVLIAILVLRRLRPAVSTGSTSRGSARRGDRPPA